MPIIALATVALTGGLTACGGASTPPPASPRTTAAGTAAPAGRTYFAVLEARHCQASEPAACEHPTTGRHDTAAIANLDGFAVARTTFAPRPIPNIGNAAPILELEGQVAAGGFYFIDGKGVVRRLEPGGDIRTVATFALTSPQQRVSFAVSPDGTRLMAAVLTTPDSKPSTDPNAPPWGTFSGPNRLELQAATAGGATSVVRKWESDTSQYPDTPGGFSNIVMAGWDAQGALALIHAGTGTQNAQLDHQRWFGGSLARLNPDGTLGPVIGPADCPPYWRPVGGRFVCVKASSQSGVSVGVIGLDGRAVWNGTTPPGVGGISGGFALSPDGARLAMDGQVVTLATNASVQLPANFTPEGWLSSDTIIGLIPSAQTAGTLGIIHLSDPRQVENWGFSGEFVGTLSAAAPIPG